MKKTTGSKRSKKDSPKKQEATKIFSNVQTQRGRTADGFINFASKLGLNNKNTISASFYDFDLLTRNRIQLEAAYRGSWIVGAVVDSVAEDMTRAGIDITTNEQEADIRDLQNEISKRKIFQSLCAVDKWARLYGGSLGVMQIDGQKLDTPLNLDTISKGQFKGIIPYDRWQLNPVLQGVIQSGPDMGLPSIYQIVNNPTQLEPTANTQTGQIAVHHTRVVRDIGIQLPYFQAITEMMWGESILERLWDRLIAFDNASMSAASLIDRANLRMIGVQGLREILAAGGPAEEALLAQFEMVRLFQVNEGLTLLDKEDQYEASSYSFSGLSDMLLQFGQQLSGACGIPLVRLFGQSPAGLSATGESDIRMYYDNIKAQQEAKFRGPLQTILQVLWRSTFGKPAPDDLDFQFVPLWQTSALDKATIAKTQAETVIGAYESGLVSRPAAMEELRASSSDTGMFSNISDEDISEAEEDDENPPLPGDVEKDPTKLPMKPKSPDDKSPAADSKKNWVKKIFGR